MATSRFELPGDGLLAAQVCLRQRMPAGDPALLRSAARLCLAWADDLRRTASTLLARAETPLWSGAAHRALVEHIRAHAPSMSATADRYEHYATALNAYACDLDQTTPRLLATRNQLRQRYDELTSRTHAAVSFDVAALPANRPLPAAAELLPIAYDFKAGYDRWADALDRCIRALSQADEADPTRDVHGLAALGRGVESAASAYLSPVERAVLHPSLHNISDCLGSLNLTLTALGIGLLLICPSAGAACLTAATVLAVAQVAVDMTRSSRGEPVSNANLGLELAAAIPLGGSAVRGLQATGEVVHLVPGGGLIAHEGVDRGHTLARHVGKSEAFLRHRLATEPGIQAASTFYDREVAEEAVSDLLSRNRRTVNGWLVRQQRQLILTGRSNRSLGVLILRGSSVAREESGIKVILRRTPTLGVGYYVHTAMVTE